MNCVATPHPLCRHALRVVGIIATAVLTVTGCSGGRPSTSGDSSSARRTTTTPSAIAYSGCMRAHGVPNFPDPDSKGNLRAVGPQQVGVSTPRYQAAEQACRQQLPAGGSLQQQTQQCLLAGDCPQVLVQQLLTVERRYAQCVRSHGIPNWPDPAISPKGGRPVFDLSGAGLDPRSTSYSRDSSQFGAKDRQCRSLVGGTVPILPYT
jgi:type II secretory pathway pseudopilin PulG